MRSTSKLFNRNILPHNKPYLRNKPSKTKRHLRLKGGRIDKAYNIKDYDSSLRINIYTTNTRF
uniref:Uncharacterized protein n=1 Tax=Anguilla anguilla TaxID=7936 RepID=A0A0E9X8R3_ANGAN